MPKSIKAQDITFILVRPRYPGNIGSAARALKNMGFAKLSLVRPSVLPTHPEALRLAVGAADILKKAKVFETIEQATKGLNFLIGASRRTGKYRQDFISLPDLSAHVPPKQKIGMLFGAEERGLTNRELAHCNLVCTIPADPDYPSLNLAQSVMVVAYELRLAFDQGRVLSLRKGFVGGLNRRQKPFLAPPALASLDQIEGMYSHLEKALTAVDFFPHRNTFHMMRAVRQVFGRTGLSEREVRIFRGICRQVLWSVTQGEKDGNT